VLIPALLSRPGVLELFISNSSSSSSIEFLSSVPTATGVGLEYVMLGFFYASFIQFPLGYLLLQRKPDPEQQQQEGPLLQSVTAAATAKASAAGSQAEHTGVLLGRSAAGLTPVEPNTARQVLAQQPGEQRSVQQLQPLPQQQQQVQMLLRGVFTPPVIACLLAVPVASIPALRSALFDPGGELAACHWHHHVTSCAQVSLGSNLDILGPTSHHTFLSHSNGG
jgi:predicted permease